jgi:ribosomal protein S24E
MRKNCHIDVVYENSSNPDTVVVTRIIHQYQGSAANITIIQIKKE